MKKVLIITGKLCVGGAERVAREIGCLAHRSEFEFHYLVFGEEIGQYEADVEKAGCRVIHLEPPSDGYAAYFRHLVRLIREEKYSVVHAHTMFNSGWAMLAARICGVPVRIAHSHSIRGFEKRGFLKNTYERIMRCVILAFATDLVACGRNAGEWLFGKRAFSRRGRLIVNGIRLDDYSFDNEAGRAVRRSFGAEDSFVIGHVGHLAAVKNQIFLIRLLPEILKHRPNAHLLLLGEGTDRAFLTEEIDSLGLHDHVTMPGNVEDVNRYLSAMDVFAFPSLYEGTPLALLEAQANGLPCLISDRIPADACATELVCARPLVPERWVEALLHAERVFPNPGLEQLKALGYDEDDMLAKIYDLYKEA